MLLFLMHEQKEILGLKMLFRPDIQNLLLVIWIGNILGIGCLRAITCILSRINALMSSPIGSLLHYFLQFFTLIFFVSSFEFSVRVLFLMKLRKYINYIPV